MAPETTIPAAYRHNGRLVTDAEFYAVACDPRRNVAVEACAGAGKTWMLVSRIVRALLEGTQAVDGQTPLSPHEILAITFTKRAAGEMRARLMDWLRKFSRDSEADLERELMLRGLRRGTGEGETLRAVAQRLRGVYRQLLLDGRQVQIRTFHSWFAGLLRAAPLAVLQQLELPLAYELLEDDEEATRLVWRRFYRVLVEQSSLRSDFEAVVLAHGRSQTEKALSVALDKRVEFGLSDAAGLVDTSVEHFGRRHAALAQFDAPSDALDAPAAGVRWLARATALGRQAAVTPQKAAQAVLDAFSTDAGCPRDGAERLARLRKGFFVSGEDRLTQHLRKFPEALEAEAELSLLCSAARQHEAWQYQQRMARLTRALVAEYAALKRERGWVDMADVERAAWTLLSDPVVSGWVQERLDTHVRHVLIDEFQDTSPLQWQALSSWLGSYAGARGAAPSVFIVGDPKQSIYRFRRAEPQVFAAAQRFVSDGLGGDLLSCDHTRRNAPEVLHTVNAVMGAARDNDGYEGFRTHTTGSQDTGLVATLPPIPRPAASEAPDGDPDGPQWRDSLTVPRELPEETLRSLEARQAASWIALQITQGLAPSDIMVLSRRRAGLQPVLLELRALRIAAQIGEKTDLMDCCEVQDVVALLDVLVSGEHDLSLARALRSPLFGVTDSALVELALRRRADPRPWSALLRESWPEGSALRGIGDTLARWKTWLDRLPPHDALQAIYTDGDVLARFACAAPATQRDTVLANLRALLAAALEVGGGRYATPYAFVRALKAGGVTVPGAVDAHAVRLLTIHGAKGLEASAVLLLDTDTPERAAETMGVLVDWPGEAALPRKFVFIASESRPPACAQPLLEHERTQRRREELNALYVAMTRARNTLAVSCIVPHRESGDSWWQRLSMAVEHRLETPAAPAPLAAGPADASFALPELPRLPVTVADTSASPEFASAGPEADTASARIGKAMHRLLEWGDASDRNALAAGREFRLDADQRDQAAAMARRVLRGAGAWVWDRAVVDWRGAEVELLLGTELLRLDRLVRHRDSGHWWVLDFKSASTPERQPELVDQLHNYRAALQALYPGETVRAAFLTAAGEVVELPSIGD